MTRINLLPWRVERRKLREREFYTMLAGAAIGGILIALMWSLIMSARIENQTMRNVYLQDQIKELDKDIAEIEDLDKTRSRLLTRKNAIEQLQANRSQMVHLFDELVKTIPDGSRLTSLKQTGDQLTLNGIAESNTRVASYMRNVDRSPWMGRSDLTKIESKTGTTGSDPKLPYQFSLDVKLLKAGEQPITGPDVDDSGTTNAPATEATGTQPLPRVDAKAPAGGAVLLPPKSAPSAIDTAPTPAATPAPVPPSTETEAAPPAKEAKP